MKKFALLLLAATALASPAFAQALFPLQIVIPPPMTSSTVFPVVTAVTPPTGTNVVVPIPAAANTVVATAAVVNSDGSTFTGTLTATGDALFTTSGLNITLARATTTADQNTAHTVAVVATEPTPAVQPEVSVTLQPATGTIACDIGPPVTAVPAEATAAGFTHCAMNLDFAQPTYANLLNWDNPNYFASQGTNGNLIFYSGSQGIKFFPPQTVQQIYDPATGGGTVMNFHWDPVENGNMGGAWTHVGQSNQVGVGTWNQAANGFSGVSTWNVGNYYMENVSRLKAAFSNEGGGSTGGPNDVYMYGAGAPEMDHPELDTNLVSGQPGGVAAGNCSFSNCGWTNWNTSLPIHGITGYDSTKYHTYGAMMTSNGSTDKRLCSWIDHVLQGSVGQQGGATGCDKSYTDYSGTLDTNFTGRAGLFISAGSNAGTAINPIDYNVQRVTIWSCASYATGMCNGTTLTNTVQSDGENFSYYH